jgi:hypothetical protein
VAILTTSITFKYLVGHWQNGKAFDLLGRDSLFNKAGNAFLETTVVVEEQ